MALDPRLKKLAKGLRAKDAAQAFVQRRRDGEIALSPAEKTHADEFEAMLEAMFLMAAVDGQVGPEEMAQLAGSMEAFLDTRESERIAIGALSHHDTKRRVDISVTLKDLNKRLAKDGWKGRLETLPNRLRTHESRTFAFRLAAAVAFCDDSVRHAEAAAIDAFAAALAIPESETQQILVDVQATLFADGSATVV